MIIQEVKSSIPHVLFVRISSRVNQDYIRISPSTGMIPTQDLVANTKRLTRILPVDVSRIGDFVFKDSEAAFLGEWNIQISQDSADAANLQEAASLLRDADIPVAFPTETVYGLGADATRSSAVRGIYEAKKRPTDNPLIVHVSSLPQLRNLLSPHDDHTDVIPEVYHSLIERFWPGPLTILLPLPTPSPLAAQVTNSLATFAVRMPSSRLALALIQIANRPLAAPSANASSKPSPTTAAHVLHDLDGRIDLILDGGPCEVGVESTVVDGLNDPPVILRPGGISIDMLRDIPGWKHVQAAYKDAAVEGTPRAPGMKYKHYSPNARVLIIHGHLDVDLIERELQGAGIVGLLTTKSWKPEVLHTKCKPGDGKVAMNPDGGRGKDQMSTAAFLKNSEASAQSPLKTLPSAQHSQIKIANEAQSAIDVWTIALGHDVGDIARGLFSALRALDEKNVDIIFVEGIDDTEGAAIMNRLRKAAESEITL